MEKINLNIFKIILFVLTAFSLSACFENTPKNNASGVDGDSDSDSDGDSDSDSDYILSKFLTPTKDCKEAWELLGEKYIRQTKNRLIANRDYMLERLKECPDYSSGDVDGDVDGDSDGDSDGPKEHSETNVQVAGIDEADFIKNDGAHIYILADNVFQIIDSWPPENAKVISRTKVDGTPKKMYVHNDRAVIYSSIAPLSTTDPNFNHGGGECTYGYDCNFTGDGYSSKITVLDISDLKNPKKIRETEFDGSYLNSRRIEDAIFSLAMFPAMNVSISGLEYYPDELLPYMYDCEDDIPFSASEIKELFDTLIKKNTEIIKGADFSGTVPKIKDTRYVGDEIIINDNLLSECPNFYVSTTGDGMNLITLTAFDTKKLDEYSIASILGRPGAVYANENSLYIASRHYKYYANGWFEELDNTITEATTVHRFGISAKDMTVQYAGSGLTKGGILNQFSMDEYQGNLRIVTTTGHLSGSNVYNTVSVLAPPDEKGSLNITGSIDNIAPGEDVRSVRFNGDVGYMVTFKKTDPLFVLDLKDPTNPAIKGELKIPGYSTYMHILDKDYILSIGFDTDEMWFSGSFSGIQLQIINVADLSNPVLVHKEIIGTRGSTSDATSDHMAFNYFKSQERLAIPMIICEGGDEGMNGTEMTFSGLLVYKVNAKDGFTKLGGIPHLETSLVEDDKYQCGNWWTTGNSKVKRSIFMDDYVYSIAKDKIKAAQISDLEHPLTTIDLIH